MIEGLGSVVFFYVFGNRFKIGRANRAYASLRFILDCDNPRNQERDKESCARSISRQLSATATFTGIIFAFRHSPLLEAYF